MDFPLKMVIQPTPSSASGADRRGAVGPGSSGDPQHRGSGPGANKVFSVSTSTSNWVDHGKRKMRQHWQRLVDMGKGFVSQGAKGKSQF